MQRDDFVVESFPGIDTIGLAEGARPLRVCIVTEEIAGPVRNGGIASTYYHLAKGLALQGHEVHVLFLKGPVVQDETPEHWVRHFADFGVTLHYLEFLKRPCWGVALQWQERFVSAYLWLREQKPFDVVHTSEWRGGLVYALMAKRLGLAFQDTLFIVKTSSPNIWNRHYQMLPIEKRDLLVAAYAEQKCVELADMVIGGSAHLISFMRRIGYDIPPTNVYVQPNIVDFSKVIVTDQRRPLQPGDTVKSRELIFFGRLEGRKGVELMCNALDILAERAVTPETVFFMGKWGVPLATQGGMKVEDYIREKAQAWNFPVEFITDKNQPQALSYMCSREMIAVMPSLIENSTMAVYEALENNIPFVATNVGGTAELIDPGDHESCLVEPKATALADRLQQILLHGQVVARATFSNDENLQIWYGFHGFVGQLIAEKGRRAAIADLTAGIDQHGERVAAISFAVLVRRGDAIDDLASALLRDPPDLVVLGFNDVAMRAAVRLAFDRMQSAGVQVRLVECIGIAAGDALDMLVQAQDADALAIAHGAGVHPRPGFFEAARTALEARPGTLFTTFFESGETLGLTLGGDLASHFFSGRAYGPEFFAMRAETYERLGRFEEYDVRRGILHEYVSRLVRSGSDDLLVYPEALLDWSAAREEGRGFAEDPVYAYLQAKPLIDTCQASERKILLTALPGTGQGAALGDAELREGGRPEGAPLWLLPAEWNRDDSVHAAGRPLIVALEEHSSTLLLYARGNSERKLRLGHKWHDPGVELKLGKDESEDCITVSRFVLPPEWAAGTSYQISWTLADGEREIAKYFLRINKLTDATFTISSRIPVLSTDALEDVLEIQRIGAKAEDHLDRSFGPDGRSPRDHLLGQILQRTGLTRAAERTTTLETDITAMVQELPTPHRRHGSARHRPAPGLDPQLEALLEIAERSGRSRLGRAALCMASRALMSRIAEFDQTAPAEVRSLLYPPGTDGEWSQGGWMKGWAWDRKNPSRVLHVAVMDGDTPLFITRADHCMPELGRRTPGLETHGFRIPVLGEFLHGSRPLLRVVIWVAGQHVRGGELALDGSTLAPRKH